MNRGTRFGVASLVLLIVPSLVLNLIEGLVSPVPFARYHSVELVIVFTTDALALVLSIYAAKAGSRWWVLATLLAIASIALGVWSEFIDKV
jgi:hypothetical protein